MVSLNMVFSSKKKPVKAKKKSPFTQAELSALEAELEYAYQQIVNAGWTASYDVCPPEMPVTAIIRPSDIIDVCKQDAETAYNSFLQLWDSGGAWLYHRQRCRYAISLFAFKQLGASIPEKFEKHITRAIGGIDASDAVEIIRDNNLWPYDSERRYYQPNYQPPPTVVSAPKASPAKISENANYSESSPTAVSTSQAPLAKTNQANNGNKKRSPSHSTEQSSSQKSQPKHKPQKKRKKGSIMPLIICVFIACVLFFGWKMHSVKQEAASNAEVAQEKNSNSRRLEFLDNYYYSILYADLFDLNTDGKSELICITDANAEDKPNEKKTSGHSSTIPLRLYIIDENGGSNSCYNVDNRQYELPWGIYLSTHNNKYYLAFPGTVHIEENGEDKLAPRFIFTSCDRPEVHVLTEEDFNSLRVNEWFQLVKEFPFGEESNDYSLYSYTIENAREQIMAEAN